MAGFFGNDASAAGLASVSWTPPTTNADGSALTDLGGYMVFYGTTSHEGSCPATFGNAAPYDSFIDVDANGSGRLISGLTEGQTYYFTVVAYDNDHNLSACATEDGTGAREVSKVATYQADFDSNHRVDIFDFNTLAANFGNTSCGASGDADRNCLVNIFDFNLLATDFGKSF